MLGHFILLMLRVLNFCQGHFLFKFVDEVSEFVRPCQCAQSNGVIYELHHSIFDLFLSGEILLTLGNLTVINLNGCYLVCDR